MRIFINAILLLGTCFLLFTLGEVLLRLYHRLAYQVPFSRSVAIFVDKELGWRGKQIFGDPRSKKIKILIVGDSFTEGVTVKMENMYYETIRNELNAEIFVYGGFGYGTLQEFLVINRYLNEINPNLVILQVSGNDFINNSPQLSRLSLKNNSLWLRPYLINNRIEYQFPRLFGSLIIYASARSRLFLIFYSKVEKILSALAMKGILPSVENTIKEVELNNPALEESIIVTEALVKKIKDRVGETPIVAFAVDKGAPYFEQFRNIFTSHQIPFIEAVSTAIQQEEFKGSNLRLKDREHWNEEGHSIAGNVLNEELRRLGVV